MLDKKLLGLLYSVLE